MVLKKLRKMATQLDQKGRYRSANIIDKTIKKISQDLESYTNNDLNLDLDFQMPSHEDFLRKDENGYEDENGYDIDVRNENESEIMEELNAFLQAFTDGAFESYDEAREAARELESRMGDAMDRYHDSKLTAENFDLNFDE